ncbi:MAG TPA: PaaI family thioesterase [Beijerinckiaceae bacterium]|nr:PaaI family thioesterase [Beijerinckiaceae bacterium]
MALMDGATFGVALQQVGPDRTGLDILRAMISGELPAPTICEGLSFRLIEAEEGRAVFAGETSGAILNPHGTVHGGWALTLIDSATGCAALSTLPAGTGYTTVETKGNFVRPILAETGLVRCEGIVLARGRQIITAEARITDSAGKLLAHGSATMLVLPARGG